MPSQTSAGREFATGCRTLADDSVRLPPADRPGARKLIMVGRYKRRVTGRPTGTLADS
jgi:hypothetical protein